MKQMLTRTIVALLLFVYGGVGVAGHLRALTFVGAGDREARVAPRRPPVQKTGRVSLYQERHLPAAPTVAPPEPASVLDLWPPHRTGSGAILHTDDESFVCRPAATRSPSRAPPVFPSAL